MQPLSAKEEVYYLEKFQSSNQEEAKSAKQVLIERNLRLVAHIAKKYQSSDVDMEDLISIGTIGLIKAIASYDVSKQSKLGTYASRCIDNEILMYFRTRKKSQREVSLFEPIGKDKEGNEIHLVDIIEQQSQDIVEKMYITDCIQKLKYIIDKCLDEREKEILYLRFGLEGIEELTQREIGEKLGISRSYISRIETKALKKLKNELEKV